MIGEPHHMDLTATLVVAGSLLSIAALVAWRIGRGDIPALPIHGDMPHVPEEATFEARRGE